MNRDRYRLVKNAATGLWTPAAECARGRGRHASRPALLALGLLLAAPAALAELPVACTGGACGTHPAANVPFSQIPNAANWGIQGKTFQINQAVDKAIVNFKSFNVGAGNQVIYQRVEDLNNPVPVAGASFTNLSRIWDANPSVIAGTISQAAGQKANVILVNNNGIAFVGNARVDLNTFTATSLNIADSFVLDQFLTNQTLVPQFEGSGGFVKVLDNAQITAGSQGRVMLLAPTVVNAGRVSAPDGQVIAAAASKVYLRAAGNSDPNVRGLLIEVDSPAGLTGFDTANPDVKDGSLDGETVKLGDEKYDKLGHVTNLGELSAARGNVTMVGFAVNQLHRASATTSVVANGSVYLLAKDRAVNNAQSQRGGRVVLGEGSRTVVLPETDDPTGAVDGATGAGLALDSQVRVLGEDIRMENRAAIVAPSGVVDFIALDNPGLLDTPNDPFKQAGASRSDRARVHLAAGAVVSVAGLEDVAVDVARNIVEAELRGDELKDSPVNRDGPLRGRKVWLDIARAQDNAAAGKNTLIARDSLEAYQARIQRGVAERSSAGGLIRVRSQGEAILDQGATLDVSGGSLRYTPNTLKTTLLAAGGVITDLADALADVRYDGIVSEQIRDFARWGVSETGQLAQASRYDPGYAEGKAAGAVEVLGMRAVVLAADIVGRTTVGERQRVAGLEPAGARLTLGSGRSAGDYKLDQRVVIAAQAGVTPAGFRFGDVLPAALRDTLTLGTDLVGPGRVAYLEVFSNKAAEVNAALAAPRGGGVSLTAKDIAVNANLTAAGGSLALYARSNNVDQAASPLSISLADGVSLDVAGIWVNDLPGIAGAGTAVARTGGGGITLSAVGSVSLGKDSTLDASGGGWLSTGGKLVAGNGGQIRLEANAGANAGGSHPGRVTLGEGAQLRAYGLGKGGTLSLSTRAIRIDHTADRDDATLDLAPDFFQSGGFAEFNLTGRDGLTLADGVTIAPAPVSWELAADAYLRPGGTRPADLTRRVLRPEQDRQAVRLSLTADATDLGDLTLGTGSVIRADAGARISLNAGHRLTLEGRVSAPGGSITASLNRGLADAHDPTNSLWLGEHAVLDVAGVARAWRDAKGWTRGEVLAGGSITLSALTGYVVAKTGALLDVSGAAPVRLDLPNEAGGIGRLVGSDAGSLTVNAREGILLDATLKAQPGAPGYRGGQFNLRLGYADTPQDGGYPGGDRVVSLADGVAPQTVGLAAGQGLGAFNGRAELGAGGLAAAGFDTLRLRARDVIRLENGLMLGEGRVLPLREVKLDSPSIETAGGDASLRAEILRLGNYDAERQGMDVAPVAGPGSLTAQANLLELAGRFGLGGMARATLIGEEEIRLAGVITSATGSATEPRPVGLLASAADLTLKAGVVTPVSYHQTGIRATGRKVTFARNTDQPAQPLSAGGSLTVDAAEILQGGNLWAPFGQIELRASQSLELEAGSLTSVAAAEGSLIPFGRLNNGRAWVYEVGARQVEQAGAPQKSIRLDAPVLKTAAGTVDLGGGGDLQAWEFTVGPGGSRDILTDAGVYAILPGYTGRFAPGDSQENAGFDRQAGDAVYLAGLPGLPAGVYTLLPAHYALLPGAYAIRLNGAVKDLLPQQSLTRTDGVRVVAGYLTDGRAGAPRDGRWSGFQVLTREQVLARSEFTLTRAGDFFTAPAGRPKDAGLLALITTGANLHLGANFILKGAAGGRGGWVDISLPDWTLDNTRVGQLNALKAESLFLGGTRSVGADGAALTVGAKTLTLANDAQHALRAAEVILAARDSLTLQAGSLIDAQGAGGDAGTYTTSGGGALVRAAATEARFTRSGATDTGTLTARGDIRASNSILLDASGSTDFTGIPDFKDAAGRAVAGNLALGGTRVSFGAAPEGTPGLVFSQTKLDDLGGLASLTLTSYSSFDLYGDARVGVVVDNDEDKITLQRLNLHGAGLAGLANAGRTAKLGAKELLLANPSAVAYALAGTSELGNGNLKILADTWVLGAGDKAIKGYGTVNVTANELQGSDTGTTQLAAASTHMQVSRISSRRASDQTLTSDGSLEVGWKAPGRELAEVTALGGRWALSGQNLGFDTQALLPSGQFRLAATVGDLRLGPADTATPSRAGIDVAGRAVAFFDVRRPSPGGRVELSSDQGSVVLTGASRVDVSAAPGGDAGELVVRATVGEFQLSDDATLLGRADADGEGARFDLDVARLTDLPALNTRLEGGFRGARLLRVRDQAALAVGSMQAKDIRISVDRGALSVNGTLDASGPDAGSIRLYARDDLMLGEEARLLAYATGVGENGGTVEIESVSGKLELAAGKVNVAGGAGGQGGRVRAIAAQTGTLADFPNPLADIGTATAFRVVAPAGVTTLTEGLVIVFKANSANTTATPTLQIGSLPARPLRKNGGDNLVAGDIKKDAVVAVMYDGTNFQLVGADLGSGVKATAFAADSISGAAEAALYGRRNYQADSLDGKLANLVKAEAAVFATLANAPSATSMTIRPATEIRAKSAVGDLTLAADWNLSQPNRPDERAGLLTLRAKGNLVLNNNLSDGFNVATPLSGTAPATLLPGAAWSFRLAAGADTGAADPLAVTSGGGDVTLAAAKLIRTGTGDIRIASGRDIRMASNASAIYTAGRPSAGLPGFVPPANAQFSEGGGAVSLTALRDLYLGSRDPQGVITGTPSNQLYSNWLFRQGALDAATGTYTNPAAWWVRFDQFQQGVATLGGGDVTLRAGARIVNVSASATTQGRVAGTGPVSGTLLKTGGGDLRIESGTDLLGGQYYADGGELVVKAGGRIDSGRSVSSGKVYTVLALGDAQARVFALGDVNIHTLLNPHLVVQSSGTGSNVNIAAANSIGWSLFSTYGPESGVSLTSLMGDVVLHNGGGGSARLQSVYTTNLSLWNNVNYRTDLLSLLPPNLEMVAHQGGMSLLGTRLVLAPGSRSSLNLLAQNDVNVQTRLVMTDMAPLPDALRPTRVGQDFLPTVTTAHAAKPVHLGDREPSLIYAVLGDATGQANTLNLDLAEALYVRAGRDVLNLGLQVQHANPQGDLSRVRAGRDIRFTQSGSGRNDNARIWVGGPGRLEVIAGRDIDLGSSAGIVSRGDLDNVALPALGADLLVAAGVGQAGIDYRGALARLERALDTVAPPDEALLWQARWLSGNHDLAAGDALAAVRAAAAKDEAGLAASVRNWLYTALRETGRDFNDPASRYAGDYRRGYAAIDLVFPGIAEINAQGRPTHYTGSLDLFASRIKTERGGGIDFLVPGGQTIVGLANTPASLVNVGNQVLGVVTVGPGDIRGFSRDDMLVNQSRILTVGGGHILLWSSEGDIDAGKGKKTAAAVPPPVIKVDAQGNVTQELQGAATGSGIGALAGQPGVKAGDVDLVAPKGTVNAGDAGIRAGNLNIAAQVILNAENIQVSGAASGVPVADTGGLSAGLAGNSALGDTQAVAQTTRSLGSPAGESQKAVEETRQALASFRPSFISVEVLGFGDGTASTDDAAERRRQEEPRPRERSRGTGA